MSIASRTAGQRLAQITDHVARETVSNTRTLQSSKLFDLTGKAALVTGGATGLGLIAAQALAANGATVYIVGRRKEALEKAARLHGSEEALGANSRGSIVPLLAGDVTDKSFLERLVAEFEKREPALHCLVNNVGIPGTMRDVKAGNRNVDDLKEDLWKETVEDWVHILKTNVISHFFTAVAFLPLLSKGTAQGGCSSSIINVTSISAHTKSSQQHIAYNVSKAAQNHLTHLLAFEGSRKAVRVRCNSLAPGIFPSELSTGSSDGSLKSHIDSEGGLWGERKDIPAGRPGNDEDYAQAVLALACNHYATNATFLVDGGFGLRHI